MTTRERTRRVRQVEARIAEKGYMRLDPANVPESFPPDEVDRARARMEETIQDLAVKRPDIAVERHENGTIVFSGVSRN